MARDRVFRWREGAEQLGITETREQAKERGRRRREKDTPELHITANRCSPITEAAGRRGATQPRLTWLIWPPFKLPHIHVCDNWGLGNDLRPSWWQLVTLFKLPQIDPLRCVDVGWGWKQDWLAISNKYVMSEPTSQSDLKCRQKTPTKNIRSAKLNNKRWLAPDRDWWYVHVNWRGGAWCYHGNSKCGRICNRVDTCTHKPTPVPPYSWAPPYSAGVESQKAECTDQALLTDRTHKTTHIVPGGSHSSIWRLMSSGSFFVLFFPHSFFFFFQIEAVTVCPRSLKEDQAEQDVVRSKQMQRWGIGMQFKTTSCKCEGTRYRHSIFGWLRQRQKRENN